MPLSRSVASDFVDEAVEQSSDPERARRYFAEFRKREPQSFVEVGNDRELSQRLALIFSSSEFLSEEILRHPSWMLELGDVSRGISHDQYRRRLLVFLQAMGAAHASAAELALFRRKEILRILVRDRLQIGSLAEITEELSNLADAILACALEQVVANLEMRFGRPVEEDSGSVASFCVVALGKLGGHELNYSSDIDLMFLYSANGETTGPQQISNKEFFNKVANQLTNLLSTYTPAGQCYRLDLRLRPEGSHGELCISLPAAKNYYTKRARDWELQMLLKARAAAGNKDLGEELLRAAEPLIYSTTLDFSTIETMSETRERIGEKVSRKTGKPGEINVKLTPGGIRDIEFLVQCLQRLHGSREQAVKDGGTLRALERLHAKDLLSTTEFSRLAHAYQFLRRVEHVLQFEHDRQTHTLPVRQPELEGIAQRVLPEWRARHADLAAAAHLLRELNQHLENVQVIYERIVHAQRPLYYTVQPAANLPMEAASSPLSETESLGEASSTEDSNSALTNFLDKLQNDPEALSFYSANAAVAGWVKQILKLSPLLAGQLTRDPQLLSEIRRSAENPARRYAFEGMAAPLNNVEGLRRFFHHEMFRIQASSICVPDPVFQTLDHTSALAEFVIARAYRIALEQGLAHARQHATEAKPFAEPQNEIMVVALGRLGMREFDIGSDADLLFIIPETEAVRQRFWTRVAERLLEIVSKYGAGGPILSIDTRLRPDGREGMLVQSESKYVDYFSTGAQAWEGIAYMKARAVAGDTDRATKFLSELQQVDWRRYGQGGRSKLDLRQMRLRLEKEQGAHAPLKAAQGSYYDADFILMYLRLRGAGMFFKSLNTPERIDILEKMGHLERADAEFLLEATTHFRALDHAVRLVTGHAGGRIPSAGDQRELVAQLLNRWTSRKSTADRLEKDLTELQAKMHRLFETVFAQ
jgi:glutamate-ammonia-ligase adenylyltransferase